MGFYIRKSVRLGGGVRLNLSSGGLGVSAGVKGFRVGMNGRGTYVHMGRGGLYYRQQFSYGPNRRGRAPLHNQPAPSGAPAVAGLTTNLVPPIDVQSSAVGKDHVIRHFEKRTQPAQVAAVVLGVIGILALASSAIAAVGAFVLAGAALWYAARAREVLVYNLEDLALARFEAFVVAFDTYFTANRKWLYETSTPNFDWKRNAGASSFIKRTAAIATSAEDRRLRTNISVPRIVSGRNQIYFLPDVVVVREGSGALRAIDYANLDMEYGRSTFIEEEGVPPDAQVVGHTWRFVRRDGGPDRRFNNNRQIPICAYHQSIFFTPGGASRTIVQSRTADGAAFRQQMIRMREQIVTVSAAEDDQAQPLAITYQPAA